MTLPISYDDVVSAAGRIDGIAHRTPVLTSHTADQQTGARLFFKCENFQRMGAFKFRGAYNALAQLSPSEQRAGVIAFSSGNHAQAVALAARLLDMPSVILMPNDAPAAKIEATRGYGAEVLLFDRYSENREALATQLSGERGMALIPPFDHPQVMAGQGTAALELIDEVGELDVLLVCCGGGGLLSGCATVARHRLPGCRIIGVEPAAGNDVQQSVARGEIVHIDVPRTIADGAQTQQPGRLTFPVIQALVSQIVTVSDEALIRAVRFFAARMKIVVEPTGALAAAAAFENAVDIRDQRAGILISGGNVDPRRYAELLTA